MYIVKMDTYLWVKLAREVLGHSQASRIGLKLLLIKHTVHLTGLAARRGGISPADSRSRKKKNIRVKMFPLSWKHFDVYFLCQHVYIQKWYL